MLVGAARDRGVARRDLDAVRRRRLDAARDHEQRRQRVAHVGRPEQEDRARPARARRRARRRSGARARARRDGRLRPRGTSRPRLDQLAHQRRRLRRRGRTRPVSTALMMAASSDGSCSSRYIATCSSVTRRSSGRASNTYASSANTTAIAIRNSEDRFGREPHPLQRRAPAAPARRPRTPAVNRRAAQRQLHAPAPAHVVDDPAGDRSESDRLLVRPRPSSDLSVHDHLLRTQLLPKDDWRAAFRPPAAARPRPADTTTAAAPAPALRRSAAASREPAGIAADARPATAAASSRGSSGVRSDSLRSTLLASVVAVSAPAPCVRTS